MTATGLSYLWKKLPELAEDDKYDEDVHISADREQPTPLTLQVLFEPEMDGVYDVGWVVEVGTELQPGDHLVRGYRVSDGFPYVQKASVRMTVLEPLVERNRKLVRGDAVARVQIPSFALDLTEVHKEIRMAQMELAQSVNAVFKGYMGYLGESGQVTNSVEPVQVQLHPENGYEELINEMVAALAEDRLRNGDIVVISEKLFAIAQKRLFPLEIIVKDDPKTTDLTGRYDILRKVQEYVPDATVKDLLCADYLPNWSEGPMATAGIANPNRVAVDLASKIRERLGVTCDVVISDTDTGLDVRETLINTITLGATPLGATAGLVIYDCMRVANAAEFCRGSGRGIPIVVCRPHPRRAMREGMGEYRGYEGHLDAVRERMLGYA